MEEITRIIREDGEAESSQKQSPLASLARPPKLSALEEAQAAWRPSPEQKEAARAALVEQRSRVELAETRRLASPPGRVWSSFGGHCIERGGMLDFVDLVDARYLISLSEHSGVVPRWQDVPDCARINRSNIWRLWGWERMFSLGILVLSCEPRESTLKPGLPHLSFASQRTECPSLVCDRPLAGFRPSRSDWRATWADRADPALHAGVLRRRRVHLWRLVGVSARPRTRARPPCRNPILGRAFLDPASPRSSRSSLSRKQLLLVAAAGPDTTRGRPLPSGALLADDLVRPPLYARAPHDWTPARGRRGGVLHEHSPL